MKRGKGLVLAVALLLLSGAVTWAQGGEKLDLNAASAKQLESLPGIGPAMAQRIVEYRETNGPFKRVEDLMNVRGIGEKKFLQLRDLVSVGNPSGQPAAPPATSASGGPRR